MNCSRCGAQLPDDAAFCPACGAKNEKKADEFNKGDSGFSENASTGASDESSGTQHSYSNGVFTVNGGDGDVSEGWLRIFEIFDRTGAFERGYSKADFKSLTFSERFKISFSILAFLFGPIYYLFKGMVLKAGIYVSCFFVIETVLTVLYSLSGSSLVLALDNFLGYGFAAFMSVMAKYDYYLLKRHNISYVRALPHIFRQTWFVSVLFGLTLLSCFLCVLSVPV